MEKHYEKFIFYGNFRKTIDVLPEAVGNKILRAIMNYGTAYETPQIKSDDPDSTIVYAIMQTIIPTLEAQKARYESKSNGGRPVNYAQEDFDILFDTEFTNTQIVEQLKCSLSTVERRKKIWNNNQQKDINDELTTTKYQSLNINNQISNTNHKILNSDNYDNYEGFDGNDDMSDYNEDFRLEQQVEELEEQNNNDSPKYEGKVGLIINHKELLTEEHERLASSYKFYRCDDGYYYDVRNGGVIVDKNIIDQHAS